MQEFIPSLLCRYINYKIWKDLSERSELYLGLKTVHKREYFWSFWLGQIV